jgi:hypothetical protein
MTPPIALYKGARIYITSRFFEKNQKLYLRSRGRYAVLGESLTVSSFSMAKTKMVTSPGQTPIFLWDIGFEECCADCNHGSFWMTIEEISGLFTTDPKLCGDPNGPGLKGGAAKVLAGNIIKMVLSIVRLWNSDLAERHCRLHFGRFTYEILDPLGTPKLRTSRLNGYSLSQRTYTSDQEVDELDVGPIVSYYEIVATKIKRAEVLESEIAALSNKLGYNVYGAL